MCYSGFFIGMIKIIKIEGSYPKWNIFYEVAGNEYRYGMFISNVSRLCCDQLGGQKKLVPYLVGKMSHYLKRKFNLNDTEIKQAMVHVIKYVNA